MSKVVDISHLIFMDLLRNLVDTTGSKVAKGNLMRIAMNTGKHVEEIDFASFEEMVEAMNDGETPLARLEGVATHISDGIFGLKQCPFGCLAKSYNTFFSTSPTGFDELTGEFNAESKMTRDFKVGLGAGVGPFCIFHQPMRSKAGSKVTVGGKPIEIIQLACKSADGKKAYADSLIEDFGCDSAVVEKVMDDFMCCYGIRVV